MIPDVGSVLARRFYARDGREVAPGLLNKVLVHGDRAVRIVEVEAYAGEEDLRAGAPLSGVERMREARPRARRDRDLANGPAKLCQALGIDGADDGVDLVSGVGPVVVDDGMAPPAQPGVSPRVGISAGLEHPWRWFVPDDPHLSNGRPGPPAGRRGR